jgi:organic radical activating enzyme
MQLIKTEFQRKLIVSKGIQVYNKDTMCYKTWNDITISLPRRTASWCCKTNLTLDQIKETTFDMDILNEHGVDFLFNHPILQKRKNDLVNGIRCPDCNGCWATEDISGESHRTLYMENSHQATSLPEGELFDLDTPATFIELDLTNKCNLACVYCGPEHSTRWQKELKIVREPDTNEELFHKVMELFSEYCTTTLKDTKYINISLLGGEPFFTEHMYVFLDYLSSKVHNNISPDTELTVYITTSMSFPKHKFDRFIEIVKNTPNIIYIMQLSGEAIGRRSELVRWGQDFEQWNNNLDMFFKESLEANNLVLGFGCAHNSLSLPYFKDFLVYINDKMKAIDYKRKVWFHINYVEGPSHYAMTMLDKRHAQAVTEQIDYMENEMINLYKKDEYVIMLKSLRSLILNSIVTPEMKKIASQEFTILEDRRKISFKSEFPHFNELVE